MKPGRRALGVAESYAHGAETSTLAGAVVRADSVVDGLEVGACTVGGTDATESITTLAKRLDRDDVQYVFVSGIALAWYNLLDPAAIATTLDRPVIAVTYEASDGLEEALRAAFNDDDTVCDRLQRYRALPDRSPVSVNGQTVYVRTAGIELDQAADVISAYTPTGGRPEPLRVAGLIARGIDRFRRRPTTED